MTIRAFVYSFRSDKYLYGKTKQVMEEMANMRTLSDVYKITRLMDKYADLAKAVFWKYRKDQDNDFMKLYKELVHSFAQNLND